MTTFITIGRPELLLNIDEISSVHEESSYSCGNQAIITLKNGKRVSSKESVRSVQEKIEKAQMQQYKTAREMAKELGIEIDEQEAQDRLDMETGKRTSNE